MPELQTKVRKTVDTTISTTYTYDLRGNLIQKLYTKNNKQIVTGAYTYDETNKMVKGVNDIGESSEYLYNGLGALVENTWIIKKNAYGYHDVSALVEDGMVDGEIVVDKQTGKKDKKEKKSQEEVAASPELNKTSTVVKQFVVDYTSETYEPLMEHEVNGLDYRYVYGNDRLSVNITGVENGSAKLIENGNQIRLYYHMDYLDTADYLTSPVSLKVESWTHYNEWGEITHNAVLKCGQRELDLVKRYATHDYDQVLGMYYAKARFYDAGNRQFVAVDPILDPSTYQIELFVGNPTQLVQYAYVQNNPVNLVDPTGKVAVVDDLVYVYVGGAVLTFSYAAWVDWVNSPEGQKTMAKAEKVIVNGITYIGNGIKTVVNGVLDAAKWVGGKLVDGATWVGNKASSAWDSITSYFDKASCEEETKNNGAKADDGTASSYDEAKKTGKKAPKHKDHKQQGNEDLPRKGTPESSTDKIDKNGNVKQRRYYDSEGQAEMDIDYSHGGTGHKFPHRHYWENGKRLN